MDEPTPAMIEAATRGDAAAIDALLARYVPRLRAFVRLRMSPDLRRRESSMDLVQTVCRELLAQGERFVFRGEAQFRGWLFTAAINQIRQKQRHWNREKREAARVIGDEPADAELLRCCAAMTSPSEAAMAAEQAARIEAAIGRLPEDYREVLTLARVVGLPHEETARCMGRSVGAVKQLLGRALAKLGEELGGRA